MEAYYNRTQIKLKVVLQQLYENDVNYDIRYGLVFEAIHLALQLGLSAGVRIDPSDPAWPVAFIELPTGQVSWHLPEHGPCWDGHTTEEKFQRMFEYIRSVS